MDLALVFLLIVINGIFAMSEIAVVSSRKSRLQNLADDGSLGAQAALSLHHEPSSFLSTIQVGITLVGILNGAIGEAAVADPLAAWLVGIPLLEPYAKGIALTVTVVGLTYFSVVVGELVPKRLALLAPEGIASLVARPMMILARITHPLVVILSSSCSGILRLLGAKRKDEPPVTDDEIKVLMEQGAEAGVFHESEQEIVSNVLRLDEQRISSIMTPRRDMLVIDLDEDEDDRLADELRLDDRERDRLAAYLAEKLNGYYVFQAIEGEVGRRGSVLQDVPEILARVADWIVFHEPRVGAQSEICETWRRLDDRHAML